MSANSSSIPSRLPVSSPTFSIWVARWGKIFSRISGRASPWPSRTLSSTLATPCPITSFLMICLAIEMAFSNGTPFAIRVPKIRVKRSTSSLATRSPTRGNVSNHPCQRPRRTGSLSSRRRYRYTPAMMSPSTHQYCSTNWPTVITTRVGKGNDSPASWNIPANRGTTKVRMSITESMATTSNITG